MKILGLDTTFNSSSAAVLENGKKVLSNIIITNKKNLLTRLLALSDFHINNMGVVIKRALENSNTNIDDISLLASTNSCSLRSTVAVSVITASTISQMFNIPIIGVDHIEAHLFSNWLERNSDNFNYPILVFSSSGASSCFVLIKNIARTKIISQVEIGGKSQNNNPKFLGLGSIFDYLVDRLDLSHQVGCGFLVTKFAKNGNAARFSFNAPQNRRIGDLNFLWLKNRISSIIDSEQGINKEKNNYSKEFISDICSSFERNVFNVLADDICALTKKYKIKEVHLAGGISANENLERYLERIVKKIGVKLRHPMKKEYSNDNAAMIASRGYYKYIQDKKRYLKQRKISIISDLKLEKIAIDNAFRDKSV